MKAADIFEKLWLQYTSQNPSAGKIYDLFRKSGEDVINDHVAFRTFNDPRTNIDVLAKPFLEAGYEEKGQYNFEQKKLNAKHFELPGSDEHPRVFISELRLEDMSGALQDTINPLIDSVKDHIWKSPQLIHKGNVFGTPSYAVYERLREESEYAAWLYVFGFRANHFTVSINHLKKFAGIEDVNDFLKQNGYELNSSGGEIKGSPAQYLEQSSTLADQVRVVFEEGERVIPSCYYEFARRYSLPNGKLFSAFIAGSADKIFESTDFR